MAMDSSVSDRNDSKTIPFKELQTPIKLAHFLPSNLKKQLQVSYFCRCENSQSLKIIINDILEISLSFHTFL